MVFFLTSALQTARPFVSKTRASHSPEAPHAIGGTDGRRTAPRTPWSLRHLGSRIAGMPKVERRLQQYSTTTPTTSRKTSVHVIMPVKDHYCSSAQHKCLSNSVILLKSQRLSLLLRTQRRSALFVLPVSAGQHPPDLNTGGTQLFDYLVYKEPVGKNRLPFDISMSFIFKYVMWINYQLRLQNEPFPSQRNVIIIPILI